MRLDADRWVWTCTSHQHYWVLPPTEWRSRGQVPLRLIVEVQFTPGLPVELATLNAEVAAEPLLRELRDPRIEVRARMAEISTRFPVSG